MTPIKFPRGDKYYQAMGWCMTFLNSREWTTDPLNNTLLFKDTKHALIVAMRFT